MMTRWSAHPFACLDGKPLAQRIRVFCNDTRDSRI